MKTRTSGGPKFLHSTVKAKYLPNQLSLIALSALFIFTPAYPFKRMIYLIGLLFVWLLSTLMIDRRWIRKSQKAILFLFGFFLLDLFYSISNGDSQLLRTFFTQKLFVYVWLIIIIFYFEHVDLLGFPIVAVLIMIAVTCMFTISGNIAVPGASRRLAVGGERAFFYHNLNVAGYDIIYGLVFLPMALIVATRKKVINPIVSIALIFVIMITLIVASYTISILLALGLIICTLADPKNKRKFVAGVVILTAFVMVFRIDILNIIIDIGNQIDSYMLVRRATQIRDLTYFSDYGTTEYNRFVLYWNGIQNFLHHPVFGKMFGATSLLKSGHSGMINYFETYGLFGLIYVFYWKHVYKKTSSALMTEETKSNFTVLSFFLVLFIFIDTIDTAGATALCSVFLSPALLIYTDYLTGIRA